MDEQNKKLDRIGQNLFKATKVGDKEIENIISNPQLFDSILAQIDKEIDEQKPKNLLFDWNWLKSSFANRKIALASFAVLFFFVIFAGVILIGKEDSNHFVKNIVETRVAESTNAIAFQNPKDEPLEFVDEKKSATKDNITKKQKPFSNKKSKVSKKTRKSNLVKPQKAKPKKLKKRKINKKRLPKTLEKKERKIFYPLPFNENAEISNENLQIVKAELSRSELFALGVNLQLENGVSKIKTELLIGEDGVARAIRVVKKF